MSKRTNLLSIACVAASLTTSPAQAEVVSFGGLVVNLCVLTVTTPGVLAPNSGGTLLSSAETGGVTATMTVVATGTKPTIQFAAPQVNGPVGWGGSPVAAISYTSLTGASQAFTSSSSTAALNALLDTFAISGRITNAAGFASGAYTLATTVTCQQ